MRVADQIRELVAQSGRLESEQGLSRWKHERTVVLSPAAFLNLVDEVGTDALRTISGLSFGDSYIELDGDAYSGPLLKLTQVVHL